MLHLFLPRVRDIIDPSGPDLATTLDADGALRYNPRGGDAGGG